MALKTISSGVTKRYNESRFEFVNKGDSLKGHLVERVTINKDGSTFQKYIVMSSDGEYHGFLGGYQLDKALGNLTLGTYVEIEFVEKKKNGKKSVKVFNIAIDDEDMIEVEGSTTPATAKDTIAAMRAS